MPALRVTAHTIPISHPCGGLLPRCARQLHVSPRLPLQQQPATQQPVRRVDPLVRADTSQQSTAASCHLPDVRVFSLCGPPLASTIAQLGDAVFVQLCLCGATAQPCLAPADTGLSLPRSLAHVWACCARHLVDAQDSVTRQPPGCAM